MLGRQPLRSQSHFVKPITFGYRFEFWCAAFGASSRRRAYTARTMAADNEQDQYVTGQVRAHWPHLLASFEARNAEASALAHWTLDLRYGPHAREVMDLRPSDGPHLGTLLYLHAGYWQSRDKSQFRFLAPGINALGWDMALANYPLCPEASVTSITASVTQALRQLMAEQTRRQRSGPVVLCGHSAGAHLAIELALQQAHDPQALAAPIAGVLAISGIYDLRPLRHTTLNERLQLDETSAETASPVLRASAGAAPALFLLGDAETPAFHAQSLAMAREWHRHGNGAACVRVAQADHFSVLEHLGEPSGLLAQTLRRWASSPRTPEAPALLPEGYLHTAL